jgi:cobalt-zinc-cadmium efflux system outer membrane protein
MRWVFVPALSFLGMLVLAGCHQVEAKPTVLAPFAGTVEDIAHDLGALGSEVVVEPICSPPLNMANLGEGPYGLGPIKGQILQQIYVEGLTEETAVQLALVNNHDLLAYYENLELGYAGLIEAGLRENPVLSSNRRYPDKAGLKVNKNFDAAISYLDYFLIPLRTRAAGAELLVIEAQVAQKVLDLVKEVEINWLEVKMRELEMRQEGHRVQLRDLARQMSNAQKEAGVISELSAQARDSKYDDAIQKLRELSADIKVARENLNRSLGLFGHETCFDLAGEIDWKTDQKLPDITTLEVAAIENRWDLEVSRREINAIAQKANLKQWWTYSNIKVGISSEQDTDGVTVTGPSLELEIPMYNFGQGEQIKHEALLAQAQKTLLGKAVQACSEVRAYMNNANFYRQRLEKSENEILPDLAKQITLAQAHHNAMALSIYELFDLEEAEVDAAIEQIRSLKNYLKARIELMHALGGSTNILGSSQ